MSLRNQDRNLESLQFYEHPSLELAFCTLDSELVSQVQVSARVHLPEIRVRSRVSVVFETDNPSHQALIDLRSLGNDIIAYQCIKSRNLVLRVGEVWGKNAVPLQFPKSRIDGISLETQADTPFIDVFCTLGNPGFPGRWSLYYHATSDNKLKPEEWDQYITQVTAVLLSSAGKLTFLGGG